MAHSKFKLSERDLDLILLEELHAGPDFVEWFAAEIGLPGAIFLSGRHSVSAEAGAKWGETDVLAFFSHGEVIVAVLIEDKISAAFTDRQADRYHERASQLIDQGAAGAYRTVLVAPKAYLDKVPLEEPWHRRITVEALAAWFGVRQDRHSRWRHEALEAALSDLARSTRFGRADVGRFSSGFIDFLDRNQLEFRHTYTENSWGLILDFIGRPKGMQLSWKINQSRVDLEFYESSRGRARHLELPPAVNASFSPENGLKSDRLSLEAPSADWSILPDGQIDVVNEALIAARRLKDIALDLNR